MKDVGRIVRTSFWEDEKVVDDFSPEDKFFMLYLLTNPHSTQIGIYKLVPKTAAFELGYSIEAVKVLIDRFQNKYKIIWWSKETGEVAIKNYLKHSIVKGGKPVYDCMVKECKQVKDKSLLKHIANHLSYTENLIPTVIDIVRYMHNITLSNTDIDIKDNNKNENENERNVDVTLDVTSDDSFSHENGGNTNSAIVLKAWNEMALKRGIATVRALPRGTDRYRQLRARIATYGMDAILEAINNVEASDFLPEERWFDFGWFVKPNNFPKILEGKYGKATASPAQPDDDFYEGEG